MKLKILFGIFRATTAATCLIFAISGLLYDYDSFFKNLIMFGVGLLAALMCVNRVRHRFAPKSLCRPLPAGASVLTLCVIYLVMHGVLNTQAALPEQLGMNAKELAQVASSSSANNGTFQNAPTRATHPDIGETFFCMTSEPFDSAPTIYPNLTLQLKSKEQVSLRDVSSGGNQAREYKVTDLENNRLVAEFEDRLIVTFAFDTRTMTLGDKAGEGSTLKARCEPHSERTRDIQKTPFVVSLYCKKGQQVFQVQECLDGTIKSMAASGYKEYTPSQFVSTGITKDSLLFIWRPEGNFTLGLKNVSLSDANLTVTVLNQQTSEITYRGEVRNFRKLTLSCTASLRGCSES